MALVTTPGAANANSWATVDEFDTYNENRLPVLAVITAATEVMKEAALIQAALLMDAAFRWTGSAVDETQAMTWPRIGMYSRNGFLLPSTGATSIPKQLKDTQCEFARQLIVGDRTGDNEAEKQGLTSVKAGPVSLTWRDFGGGSNSVALRDADIRRMGSDLAYVSRVVPDVVRMMLVPSWYTQALISLPLTFEANR